jgi:hypothetical protein
MMRMTIRSLLFQEDIFGSVIYRYCGGDIFLRFDDVTFRDSNSDGQRGLRTQLVRCTRLPVPVLVHITQHHITLASVSSPALFLKIQDTHVPFADHTSTP